MQKMIKTDEGSFEDLKNGVKEFEVLHKLHHPCICQAKGINIQEQTTNDKGEILTTIGLYFEYIDFNLKHCLSKEIINNTLKTRLPLKFHMDFVISIPRDAFIVT